MRSIHSAGRAAIVLVVLLAGCGIYDDLESAKKALAAQFPENAPKVNVRNGRTLVVKFEKPSTKPVSPQAVAKLVASALPPSSRFDSVEVVTADYEAKLGLMRAAVERTSSFAVRDLKGGSTTPH